MVIIAVFRRILTTFRKNNFGILTIATLLLICFGTFGGYLAEHNINNQFANLGDSFWWTIVTLSTVGFGDKVPITVTGRVIGAICMIAGPLLLVSFVGAIGIQVYDHWMKGVRGMMQVKSKMHLIICGWNKKTEEIINEIQDSTLADISITIIADNISASPVHNRRISFIKGNSSELQTLQRANINQARYVIVLAENGMPAADQKTVLTVLAIKKSNPSAIISAELIDINNEEHLKQAGCEITINAPMVSARLLSMSILNPTANAVISELISQKGNEVYRIKTPEKYIGIQFLDALSELKKHQNILTIGIERGGNVLLNIDAKERIQPDDLLMIISEDSPPT